jgi:N-acetylneuraminic acid mutarotase
MIEDLGLRESMKNSTIALSAQAYKLTANAFGNRFYTIFSRFACTAIPAFTGAAFFANCFPLWLPTLPVPAAARFNFPIQKLFPIIFLSLLMKFLLPLAALMRAVKRLIVLMLLVAVTPLGFAANYSPCAAEGHAHASAFLAADPGTWTFATPNGTPVSRHECAFVEANGKFYLLGGRSNRPVNIYNPTTNTWTQSSALPKNAQGQTLYLHHFQAVSLNGLIYVVGAFIGDYPNETPVPNVYIYNPTTNVWAIGPSIPQGRRRGSAGVVVYNQKIYLIGGITNGHTSGFVKWLDEFDPATGIWRTLPDANFARDHFHAAVVGNKLYAAGGRRTSGATGQVFSLTVREVDVFDFGTRQWLPYPNGMAPIPTQRAGTTVAVLGGEVVVIGGESGNNTGDLAHNQAEALNPATGTWRSLAPLNTGRHGTQALVYGGKIYIAAGSGKRGGSPELNSLESFSFGEPVFTQWTQRAPALGKRAEGQSIRYNDKIYVFNGFAPGLVINNSNEAYNPTANQWTALAPMPKDPQGKPYAVTHNGIALVDNTIWIVGGRVGNVPGPVTDKVWIYNITTNSWSPGPTLPAPRAGGGLVRLGRRLHLFGGFGPSACNSDKGDHFAYDLDNPGAGWRNILAPLPNPRNHFGTAAIGGKIYAIGGQYGHDCGGGLDVKLVHVYDAATNTWAQKKDLPYANSHLEPGTFALDGTILVVGGESNGRNVLRYNPSADTWTVFDQVPVALIAPSAKVVNNTFVVSHGGAPNTENSQNTTWVKTIARSKSNLLSFWTNGLSVAAPTGGSSITKKMLLWTHTGTTPYAVNAAGAPAWLKIQAGPGTTDETGAEVTLTFNPAGLSPGTYGYTLTAAAAGYTNATSTISFTVQNTTNPAPVVTNPGAQTSGQGEAVTLQIKATGATPLTYAATGLPPGLGINGSTGLISGTVSTAAVTGSAYNVQVSVTDGGSPGRTTAVSFTWTVMPAATQVLARINAGGPAVSTNGIAWGASQYFTGGKSYTNVNVTGIAGTANDAVYLTEYSATTNLGGFSFALPVPAGAASYTVKLHFAEIYWGATGGGPGGTGKRVFSVNFEGGTPELVNYDIFAEVGAMTAVVKTFGVTVSDGTLNISFTASVDQPKISAIEVFGPAPTSSVAARTAAATDPAGQSHGWHLYPNPARDRVTLALGADASLPARILLVNPLGQTLREVRKTAPGNLDWNLRDLPAGLYYVVVQGPGSTERHKLVKQ